MAQVTHIKTIEDLKNALNGQEGLIGVEQGLQVYSKRQKEWTRAGMRPKSVEKIIEQIFSAETKEDFEKLPKLGLMFEYQGTPEEYKPAVIVFTETYEDSMRKLQKSDYALVVKRTATESTENDEMISQEAMSAFTFAEEKETTEKTKKGGRK